MSTPFSSKRIEPRRVFRRRLGVERLETRRLLAVGIWDRMVSIPTAEPGAVSYLNLRDYSAWSIDQVELSEFLSKAPMEFSQEATGSSFIFSLPRPDGALAKFQVVESPIMEPALAAEFPTIKTYRGQGIDDPAASLRFDVSPLGFRAQVLAPSGAYYIDPYWHLNQSAYVSYFKRDLSPSIGALKMPSSDDIVKDPLDSQQPPDADQQKGLGRQGDGGSGGSPSSQAVQGRSGLQLRTYRLANAATGEYTRFQGGTVVNGQAAIVTTINRVTGIYEKDLAVRLVLVANNSSLVYTDPANDPYSNDNGGALLGENQRNIDSVIGNDNYDIGHVFGTGGGGLAGLGVVGVTGRKAQGQTGSDSPVGDPFDVDYVAHEIGHQFGGNHTFNGTNGACGGNRSANAAYEPGSGTTVMAYAGICGADDLQRNSDPYFHSYSFDEIVRYTTTGIGNAVAAITNTGNRVPVVYAGKDYVIPAATPFFLDSVGTDQDARNVLSYHWEQRDLGPGQALNSGDNGSSPLFRSWNPSTDTSRTLPRLAELINNATPRGERLPTTNRSLNFRAIVRDNFAAGGGVNTDDMRITVVDTGAPFAVTNPNAAGSFAAGSQQAVTWNVANTSSAPISENQVDIWLSIDGGLTFPILLAGATANDGTESIVLPDVASTRARIKVASRNSIFFDISNADFSITNSSNNAPTISDIANVWIPVNSSSAPIAFQIGDAETPVNQLAVTAFSTNKSLVPDSRIEFSGTGTNRFVRVRPLPGEFGETRIYVGVTDERGVTAMDSFLVYVDVNSTPTFGLNVSESSVDYIENDPPVQITSTATVVDNIDGDYSNGSLLIEMSPDVATTDLLTLDYSGDANMIQVGQVVLFGGQTVARFNRISDTVVQFVFNAQTSVASIESIAKAVRFEARGDSPMTTGRSVSMTLSKGDARSATLVDVRVLAVNDSPVASDAPMDEIDEDEINPPGTRVDALIARGVTDVDGTLGQAIALTSFPNSPGKWQYNLGGSWQNLDNISNASALVLGPTSRLRFLPGKDFFGVVPPLKYYGLDTSYTGTSSTSGNLVLIDIQSVNTADSISRNPGEIRQMVRPINDPPIATGPTPSTAVFQDSLLRYSVPSTIFTDVDDSVLTYSAFTSPGVKLPSWLRFNETTRTFEGTPTNLDVGIKQYTIRATDRSGAFGDIPIIVEILNVNDTPLNVQLLGSQVLENRSGAYVGLLTATDPDPNDTITWSIINNPSNRFEVRGNELYLKPLTSLDFEAEPFVNLIVRATDNGTPVLFRDESITVNVQDANEFAPTFSPVTLGISEAAPMGAEIGRLVANDRDTANQIRYRFFGVAPSEFSLSDSGVLRVKSGANLDFETISSYRFFVEAFDNGSPSLSTWVSATVNVLNVNEFSPQILTESLTISESYPVGANVGRIVATDGDNQPVVYSLPASETRFSIHPTTGFLSLNRGGLLDFERTQTEFLTVIATDSGPDSAATTKTIRIAVTNANEPPNSITLEVNPIPENIAGLDLGRLIIQDPDGPTNYLVTPLDERFEVLSGKLALKPGRFLSDQDPRFVSVPLLLSDTAAGAIYRQELVLQVQSNPAPWRNPRNPLDVDRDGRIGPLDVLAVINAINASTDKRLPLPRNSQTLNLPDIDVDGDGQMTPLDVLSLVNALNIASRGSGEGENPRAPSEQAADLYFAEFMPIDPTDTMPTPTRVRRFGRTRM